MTHGDGMQIYRSHDGSELAVIAATWHLNPKVTKQSLSLQFEKDPDLAWRNFGSVLKAGLENALHDGTIVDRLANRGRMDPWNSETKTLATWFVGEPGQEYFVHIDLAKNHDAAGVCIGHANRKTDRVVLDLLCGLRGERGRDIQVAEVRQQFVYDMTARGFHIKKVTYDQWQSLESQQQLAAKGYEVEELSADKTKGPYDTLFELLKQAKLDYYLQPQFIKELQQLRRYDKKYDHPRGGSKDIADAAACVAFGIKKDMIENPYTGEPGITIHRSQYTQLTRSFDVG